MSKGQKRAPARQPEVGDPRWLKIFSESLGSTICQSLLWIELHPNIDSTSATVFFLLAVGRWLVKHEQKKGHQTTKMVQSRANICSFRSIELRKNMAKTLSPRCSKSFRLSNLEEHSIQYYLLSNTCHKVFEHKPKKVLHAILNYLSPRPFRSSCPEHVF